MDKWQSFICACTILNMILYSGWHKVRDGATSGPRPIFSCKTKRFKTYVEFRYNMYLIMTAILFEYTALVLSHRNLVVPSPCVRLAYNILTGRWFLLHGQQSKPDQGTAPSSRSLLQCSALNWRVNIITETEPNNITEGFFLSFL